MTGPFDRHGLLASHLSLSGHRPDCVSLLISGSCRCVGLHRSDGAMGDGRDYHQTDCIGAEHFGRIDYGLTISVGRPLRVENILAVRAAIGSGCLFWWLSP